MMDHAYTSTMDFDPLSLVEDAPIQVNEAMLADLRRLIGDDHVAQLPGVDTTAEKLEANPAIDALLQQLIDGLGEHPRKRWVLGCFQSMLAKLEHYDTEYRDHVGFALERIMEVVQIESSDGLLAFYLGGL